MRTRTHHGGNTWYRSRGSRSQLVTGPSAGTLQLNPSGGFIYTPETNFFATDSFTFKVSDGLLSSATQTATITIDGVLDAEPDSYTVLHDQVLSIDASNGVLANDNDSDGDGLIANLVTAAVPARARCNSTAMARSPTRRMPVTLAAIASSTPSATAPRPAPQPP